MSSLYPIIKHSHLTLALLSVAGFILRGAWMMAGSPMLQRRWVRVLPHVVDTLLLATAVVLVVMLSQYPFVHGWVTAKVLGLVAYIVLGTLALKRAPTLGLRILFFFAALLCFAYIFGVARMHSPASWWLLW
jgi:uncharacterized membrane protein SirB2